MNWDVNGYRLAGGTQKGRIRGWPPHGAAWSGRGSSCPPQKSSGSVQSPPPASWFAGSYSVQLSSLHILLSKLKIKTLELELETEFRHLNFPNYTLCICNTNKAKKQ